MNPSTDPHAEPLECQRLFSYGTLQPDHAPEEIAEVVRSFETLGKGYVQGILYDLGPYPGAVLDPATSRQISGTVFGLPNDRYILPKLDEYEDYHPESPQTSLFIRRLCTVRLANGQIMECWIYEYNGRPNPASIVGDGIYTP